ncbi:hypothetical protein E2C01_037221 [Portunus trituberculatus]|uniref:Uncharacterized protein n=1 Tax=Portunus trituberculatus TaxID=210409 RepID=A0A5B7F8T0_PORTR|nr:hypothetical protein [Portunus trituberculatus]
MKTRHVLKRLRCLQGTLNVALTTTSLWPEQCSSLPVATRHHRLAVIRTNCHRQKVITDLINAYNNDF